MLFDVSQLGQHLGHLFSSERASTEIHKYEEQQRSRLLSESVRSLSAVSDAGIGLSPGRLVIRSAAQFTILLTSACIVLLFSSLASEMHDRSHAPVLCTSHLEPFGRRVVLRLQSGLSLGVDWLLISWRLLSPFQSRGTHTNGYTD